MSKKSDNNYFSMLESMADCSLRAANELERILNDFQVDTLDGDMERLHAIEHEGDGKRHALAGKLLKEFITPIEREDIMQISEHIDDVTDAVEDVLLQIYMLNVESIQEDAVVFAGIIRNCCHELLRIFQEFSDFKKSKELYNSIVELNRLEEMGDALYIKAVRRLHTTQMDGREAMVWTEIYNRMENACDTCEKAADLVEHVIMKNT